jgi:hypothetical protein
MDLDTALHRAIMHLAPTSNPRRPGRAHVKPLLDYIGAKPLCHAHDRQKLVGLVRHLFACIDELMPRRGRPARTFNKATPAHERAEGYAVQLVRWKWAQWRRKHHRERVPAAETDRMIQEAIREAARRHKAKVWQIREAKIRSALKSGRR